VLFDDVGFGSFGCYGAEIATPTIDARTSWSWRTASRRWNACSRCRSSRRRRSCAS